MSISAAWGLEPDDKLDNPTKGFIAGMECEIEQVHNGQVFNGFSFTEDGSLRCNGAEYISDPMDRMTLLKCFKNLHAQIKLIDPSKAFSFRTSTHVHVNCRTLEMEQVKNIVLLYALFEEVFFAMVDPSRRSNIHCVPLTETYLPNLYREGLPVLHRKWHKYTALNILPLNKIGTIEFRHLQGTNDAVLIDEWLTALENLWNLGKVIHISPESLSSSTTRMLWYSTIFGHSKRMMDLQPIVPNMIKNSVIDVKMSFLGA